MACKTSFELHHNFPKLAEESGFTFNTHKPRVHIEWNKIRLIDIESLIRDRKFLQIEQHTNDILDCVLESEFDVRILDEGVLKIFRLAQLAVEYHQFCRHYLDRSVYVLREEITGLAQELDYAKKTIRERDDEIRKHKRKSKYNIRAPLPYGNDNIASMILQTLANKRDIFPTTTQIDNVHYNKCGYCDKVFMNQLYLKSHISRRHSNVDIPQKDLDQNEDLQINNNEQLKLQNEITELRSKLNEMEVFIKFTNAQSNGSLNSENKKNTKEADEKSLKEFKVDNNTNKSPVKQMKDAEVSTNSEGHILDKIEEWKKEEFEKYNKELNLLRTQITSIIDSNKDTDKLKSLPNDNKMMDELHKTIKQQSAEISSLKEELINSRLKLKNDENERKKEIESQIAFWAERTEGQSKEYKLLLQKLDVVAKEAQESRERAELEERRALKLQHLLEQNINNEAATSRHDFNIKTENLEKSNGTNEISVDDASAKSLKKTNPVPDRITLEKLHRKAQELLNQSITSSDASSVSDGKIHVPVEKRKALSSKSHKKKKNDMSVVNDKKHNHSNDDLTIKRASQSKLHAETNVQAQIINKNKPPTKKSNGSVYNHGSPLKVIRAKLTEEVNQRLISLGVDPLKKRLPQDIFSKHRLQIQENNEIKTKKNPAREKINHSIMSDLDKKATITTKNKTLYEDEYVSPNRSTKPFSLSSVISNVKTKALSLVKANEGIKKDEMTPYGNITRKALSLLKTPPDSATTSPKKDKENLDKQSHVTKESIRNQYKYEKQNQNRSHNSYVGKMQKVSETSEDSDINTTDSVEYSKKKILTEQSIQNNFKSPNRRPSTTSFIHETNVRGKSDSVERKPVHNTSTKHETNEFEKTDTNAQKRALKLQNNESSSDDNVASLTEQELRNAISDENVNSQKQTKGVLKSASSMSSLYKKKVLFDMDAIQMKSVSASPSQSVTEKSEKDEKYELGVINLDTEEWDLSSIENEQLKDERIIKLNTRTSPKIAELKQSIESQLKRRNQTLSTALVGGVDVLKGPMITKAASLGGSNTSLGSSILDDSESVLHQNHTAIVKPKNITDKEDSEIDISELVGSGIEYNNKR